MGERDDWLMRPVLEGMCRYESLKNCELDLLDIARMNDALDVQYENERRLTAALRSDK
jgi:hypothetical protein